VNLVEFIEKLGVVGNEAGFGFAEPIELVFDDQGMLRSLADVKAGDKQIIVVLGAKTGATLAGLGAKKARQ
jgi:hypothetical protein